MMTTANISDQRGKTALITESGSGLGFQTAKALYLKGARIIMACRDMAEAELSAWELTKLGATGSVETWYLDLYSLSAIKEFSELIMASGQKIDILINNARIMSNAPALTKDGYELQFGANFLAHYALSARLYPLIRQSNTARIVNLTDMSYAHGKISPASFRSLEGYEPYRAYSQSMLANFMFSRALQQRINLHGGHTLSLTACTGIAVGDIGFHIENRHFRNTKTPYATFMGEEQGCLPILYAAGSPAVEQSGFYGADPQAGPWVSLLAYPIHNNAMNQTTGSNLWDYAVQQTGLEFP